MNTYGKRLKHALSAREINQSELARELGVKPQAVQYLVAKANGSSHTSEIARILRIPARWLTHGHGSMEDDDKAPAKSAESPPSAMDVDLLEEILQYAQDRRAQLGIEDSTPRELAESIAGAYDDVMRDEWQQRLERKRELIHKRLDATTITKHGGARASTTSKEPGAS